jgi:hypothetical protein|tara:strand:- start:441 stop:614 length:174 start_codon:yes stop_codon:yes gene_type:complete
LDIAGVILLQIPSKSRYEKMADFAEKKLAQEKAAKPKPKKRGRPKKVAEVAVKEEEE